MRAVFEQKDWGKQAQKKEIETGERPKTTRALTAVKREKFAKNKKNNSKEMLSFLLFEL